MTPTLPELTPEMKPYRPYGAAAALFKCKDPVVLVDGPKGCVAGETRIYNPETRENTPIFELWANGIAPIVQTLWGPRQAEVPFAKGIARLYRVTLVGGPSCIVTSHHRFLTRDGWKTAAELPVGGSLLASAQRPLASCDVVLPSVSLQDASRWSRKVQGWHLHYLPGRRPHDAQLRPVRDTAQVFAPSRGGVLERSHDDWHRGGPVGESAHSRACLSSAHLSTRDSDLLHDREAYTESHNLQGTYARSDAWYQWRSQSPSALHSPLPSPAPSHHTDSTHHHVRVCEEYREFLEDEALDDTSPPLLPPLSSPAWSARTMQESLAVALASDAYNLSQLTSFQSHYTAQWGTVQAVEYVRTDIYFDLHVPDAEHYLAEGIWHHNTGKSVAWLTKLFICAEKYPKMRGAIMRKTRKALTGGALVTWERDVVPPGHAILKGAAREQRSVYRFPNGSEVIVRGLDDTTKQRSNEFDLLYIQEATELEESDFYELPGSMRSWVMPYQQIGMDCNPDAPRHWLRRMFLAGEITRLPSFHQDNPLLWDREANDWTERGREYMAGFDHLPPMLKKRLKDGEWAAAEGAIYDAFDPDQDVVEPFDLPAHWPRYVGLDFGGTNTAAVFFAVDPDTDILYAYREYLAGGRTAGSHVAWLTANEKIRAAVGGAASEDQWRREFTVAGLPVIKPLITDVTLGITRVYGQHQRHSIKVFNTLTEYLQQKQEYRYDTDANDPDTIEDKHRFHLMDAERYLVGWLRPERQQWRGGDPYAHLRVIRGVA